MSLLYPGDTLTSRDRLSGAYYAGRSCIDDRLAFISKFVKSITAIKCFLSALVNIEQELQCNLEKMHQSGAKVQLNDLPVFESE